MNAKDALGKILSAIPKEVTEFRSSIDDETDRGCALMSGQFLANELEKLLKKKLIGNKKLIDELFNYTGPLGTFSGKTKFAYSLGLISSETMREINLVREIRNKFGHDAKPLSFSTPVIAGLIGNLQFHPFTKKEEARKIFTNSVLGVLAFLHGSIIQAEKFVEKENTILSSEFKQEHNKRVQSLKDIIADSLNTTQTK